MGNAHSMNFSFLSQSILLSASIKREGDSPTASPHSSDDIHHSDRYQVSRQAPSLLCAVAGRRLTPASLHQLPMPHAYSAPCPSRGHTGVPAESSQCWLSITALNLHRGFCCVMFIISAVAMAVFVITYPMPLRNFQRSDFFGKQ